MQATPVVLSSSRTKLLRVRALIEGKATLATKPSTLPENLRKAYERFQTDDGVPIYLKAGLRDRIFFLLTVGLVAYGTINSYYTLLTMAFPKK